MRIFRCFIYQTTKRDKPKALFETCETVLSKLEWGSKEIKFYLTDFFSENHISAIDRLVKKFPVLTEFMYNNIFSECDNPKSYKVLSNFPIEWYKGNPNKTTYTIDIDTVGAIMNGIPRAYPLNDVYILFDKVNWLGLELGEAAYISDFPDRKPLIDFPGYLSSSIIIKSDWWISGRINGLIAVVEVKPPGNNENRIPKLNDDIICRLRELGRIRFEQTYAVADKNETNLLNSVKKHAEKHIMEAKRNIYSKNIKLPYDLPNPLHISSTFEALSPKKAIVDTFKPRGYKYLSNMSGLGLYRLSKTTPLNNQITVVFEFAPMCRALSSSVEIKGPLWKYEIDFPLSYHNDNQYPVSSAEILEKLVMNAGAIVDYLEGVLVKELEDIYGPAPKWFEY